MREANHQDLKRELRQATRSLHKVAARLNATGLLSKSELREYRRFLKAGADHRFRGPDAEEHLRTVMREVKAREGQFRSRMKNGGQRAFGDGLEVRGASGSGTCSKLPRQSLFAEEADAGKAGRVRELADRVQVAEFMVLEGLSSTQALEAAGLEGQRTARWARKCASRYRRGGVAALEDRRKYNGARRTISNDEVRRIIMATQQSRPAAGARAVANMVQRHCRDEGLPEPSESTVKAVLSNLPPGVLSTLRGEHEEVRKKYRLVRRTERASFGSERWQADHSTLDIWVKRRENGVWVPAPAYMTVSLDAFSRAIPGFFLSSAYPDAHAIGLMMYHSCRKKGRPDWVVSGAPHILQVDRGADFISEDVTALCAALGTQLELDPPNYPDAKAKIERFFGTLDRGLLRTLPGHKAAYCRSKEAAEKQVDTLLTLPELRARVEKWIAETYHHAVNRRTGEAPAPRWLNTARPRPVTDETVLRMVLSASSRPRTVTNEGVELPASMGGGLYFTTEMAGLIGRKVRVHWAPDYLDEIALYCARTSEFLCVAHRLDSGKAPSIEEVKAARGGLSKGIRQVVEPYLDRVEAFDRPKASPSPDEPAPNSAEASQVASGDSPQGGEVDEASRLADQFVESMTSQEEV